MDRNTRKDSGFTLIELLIVTAVLAIIMGIAVAALVAALDKARQGATIADMRNLGTAIEAYNVDNGFPPDDDIPFTAVSVFLRSYHNRIVPTNDHWGHPYDYESEPLVGYTLFSYGKDGIDGDDLTEDTKKDFIRDILLTNGEFPGLK